jgi:AcrR family transcriptional regulator
MTTGPADNRLWTRTRRAAYAEIAAVAMRLFLEHGFDATTIDDIAEAAGISRRSFFRYFGTKEDIVLGDLARQGLLVQTALQSRPATEHPWEALLAALAAVQDQGVGEDPETMLKISKMLYETPSLRARSIEKHLQWQALLVPDIRQRLGIDPHDTLDPRADAIVASVLACLDVAGEIWTRSNGTASLAHLVTTAVAAIRT